MTGPDDGGGRAAAGRPEGAAGTRRPYHHGSLRQALVTAGLAILERDGLGGLTLRAIAAGAGVSHAAPRRHFPTLRALHTAIAAEGFRRHAAAMRAGPDPSREGRLGAALQGYVAFATAHPALFALMFSPDAIDHADDDLARASGESYGVLAGVARGLAWPGAEGPDRQARTEAMLWSFAHGFASLAQGGQSAAGFDVRRVVPAFRYEGPS